MAERTYIRFTFLEIDPARQRRAGAPGAEDRRGTVTGAAPAVATGGVPAIL
ncbi:MAG: hypothetical protein KJ006_07715 [Thermoleophilia bacterium]|nr:hypothetical protein [Thermoleophilia bacterium]